MPKKVEQCVKALTKKGHSKSEAWAICTAKFGEEENAYETLRKMLRLDKRRFDIAE